MFQQQGSQAFTLHGGFGIISRRHGLAIDHVLAARIVNAKAEIQTVDEKDKDLFWALRGAGSILGVVTAIKIRIFKLPESGVVFGGALVFDASTDEKLRALMKAQQSIWKSAPNELTCHGIIANPPPAHTRAWLIQFLWTGDEDAKTAQANVEKCIKPLLDVAKPVAEMLNAAVPYAVANSVQDSFGPDGFAWISTVRAVPEFSDEVIEALIALEAKRCPPTALPIEHWGGQVKELGKDMLLPSSVRNCSNAILCLGMLPDPALKEPTLAYVNEFKEVLGKIGVTQLEYYNYGGSIAKEEATKARLQKVKDSIDPSGFFRTI
eukprot:TRINITY_DN7407_c0_g1_i1.p1 TRINITY_DN7407_c0_g1~~TRINITY_DN7407_c0_g1_i1.p1  ORF type:complete len:322 (+),score=69.40 TRINITY_DN7407_c0_g1_i1:12-977(+)